MNLDVDYLNNLAKRIISLEKNVLEISKIERYKLWQSLIKSSEYANKLNRFGFKVYSQNDQDGIIEKLCEILDISKGTFIEFGCGDGMENNTRYLNLKGWKGLWLDSDSEKVRFIRDKFTNANLDVLYKKVTVDNINDVILEYLKAKDSDLDLLSIDTDWNDYYLFEALNFKPQIIVIEYNSHIPPNISLTVPRNDDAVWDGSAYYGTSLKALNDIAIKKDYVLVGCSIAGTDAFFVRTDLIKHLEPNYRINELYVPKFGVEFFNCGVEYLYEPPRFNLAFNMGHINFLDNWINLEERKSQ